MQLLRNKVRIEHRRCLWRECVSDPKLPPPSQAWMNCLKTGISRKVVFQKNRALRSNPRFSGASGCRQSTEIGTSMAPSVPSCVMMVDGGLTKVLFDGDHRSAALLTIFRSIQCTLNTGRSDAAFAPHMGIVNCGLNFCEGQCPSILALYTYKNPIFDP